MTERKDGSIYAISRIGGGHALVSTSARRALGEVDTVVFDCDGVLIDVHRSYDAAVIKTTERMVHGFTGTKLSIRRIAQRLILKIRRTGGFNSDWDTTYALTLFAIASLSSSRGRDPLAGIENMVKEFASTARVSGSKSVDEFIQSSQLDTDEIRRAREYLGYPGSPPDSLMSRAFDELYYGEELFCKIYGMEASVISNNEKGLIDQERILVTRDDLMHIERILGGKRIAMATGRPFVAVQHTLGNLVGHFNREASVFIGDSEIYPELAPQLEKYKKPSGASLVLAKELFSSGVLLYVGDSAEDRLMVIDAKRQEQDDSVLFGGIYGTAFSQTDQISYFTGNRSDLVIKSVSQLPYILEGVKKNN